MKKILIAEDHPDNRELLCQALEEWDCEVILLSKPLSPAHLLHKLDEWLDCRGPRP